MDDVTTYLLLATSFFFVALAFALLVRYRQVSQRINASTDLGRDLWSSLEQRLKKQDERILDVMGRLEVVQARVMSAGVAQHSTITSSLPPAAPIEGRRSPVIGPNPPAQQPKSQESRQSQAPPAPSEEETNLDATQLEALGLLGESAKNTRQLTDALQKSREHTARLMKELFEMGLVKRSDASKPFVYELTDEGRRRLSPSV